MKNRICIGYEKHDFEYEGKVYPMVRLYTVTEIENGYKPLKEINAKQSVVEDLESLINADIQILYNQYGKVCKVKILNKEV